MPLTKITKLGSIGMLAFLMISPSFAGPQHVGLWSERFDWPVGDNGAYRNVLLTPQGNILTISKAFGTPSSNQQVLFDVWNPKQGTGSSSHNTISSSISGLENYSSVLMPETGKVLITGGTDPFANNRNAVGDYIFDTQTNTVSAAASSAATETYQTRSMILPNGEILVGHNLGITPEVYSPNTNQWRTLTSASPYYPDWVAPNGEVLGDGGFLDPSGSGSFTAMDDPTAYSEANLGEVAILDPVMYRPGKLFSAGGTFQLQAGPTINDGLVTTLSGRTLFNRVTQARPYSVLSTKSSIMLPTGNVMNKTLLNPECNTCDFTRRLEIWDAATESWTLMLNEDGLVDGGAITLLKDGRVLDLSFEGGLAFSPPYLFDDTGNLANRPEVVSAPAEGTYDNQIAVEHGTGDTISRVTLLTAGRTDGFQSSASQRFFELEFDDTTDGVNVKLPNSANIAPPGYYVMYLIDSSGVPSEGHMISLSGSGQDTGSYPTSTADYATATGSGSITIDALANDSGSGLTLNAPNAWSLKGGNVALVNNKITYTPKAGFNGEDKIWYTFQDSQGRIASGEITITVSGNNGSSSPYPTSAQDNVTTTTATSVTIDVLANDTGDGLTLNTPNAWSMNGGTVSLVGNKLVYQSKAGFTGNDNIWYTFKDSQGRGNSGQVNITVNSGGGSSAYPVANADYYTTSVGKGKNLNILANDTGGVWRAIDTLYQYTAEGGTSYKTPEGQVWYTPKAGFTGEDNFWYVMVDSEGRKNSAQVKINVTQ